MEQQVELEKKIKAVQQGDYQSYRYIVCLYEKKMFATIVRMVRHTATAEDLVQEIFIKAYRNIDKYTFNGSFSGWLFRLATNHCLDFLKKQQPIVIEDETQLVAAIAPEKELLQKERAQQLTNLLEELEQTERLILILKYVDGLRYEEIAHILQLSHTDVRNKLYRSKKKLRQSVKGAYFHEM